MDRSESGAAASAAVLEHHGIKGMKWGVRRKGGVSLGRGPKPAPSHDFQNAQVHRQTIKRGGTKALSNKELQDLVTRMNLEQQYSTLTAKNKRSIPGKKFVGDVLVGVGKQQATRVTNNLVTGQVDKMMANLLKNAGVKV